MSSKLVEHLRKTIVSSDQTLTYGNSENKKSTPYDITEEQFFENIKSSTPIETFKYPFGIQGFTLAYGNFCYKNFLDIDSSLDENEIENSYERMDAEFENYKKLLYLKNDKNVCVYRLPCCWPSKTSSNCFIGVNIYPLIWTDHRYFWKEIEDDNGYTKLFLDSAMDSWIMTKERKEELLKELSQYNLYQLPKCIKEEVQNIESQFYSRGFRLDKSLYLSSYSVNEKWNKILRDKFSDIIQKYDEVVKNETGKKGVFCMVPNDCCSCT